MKKVFWILLSVIAVYLFVSAIRPDVSQDWRDEWRSLFEDDSPITVLASTPTPASLHAATPTPQVNETSDPIRDPVPTRVPTPTSTPSVTPPSELQSGFSQTRLESAREYALSLINQARVAAGLNEVILDDNAAAQSHADDMRANCTFSHWGTDGLKPYMRYTLAGGEQYSAENISGIDFCPSDPNRYTAKTINAVLDEAMTGLMNSPGHRRNILNPHHRKVNIGISYRRPTLWLVQLFVGGYVEYESKPTIEDGLLTFSGTTKNGALVSGDALGVQIYYHQPPHSLSRGQLHHSGCYSSGLVVAGLRPPIGANQYYPNDSYTLSGTKCGDPYDVDVNAPVATSYFYEKLGTTGNFSTRVPWITATRWDNDNGSFDVAADIRDIVKRHGDGVYTVIVWGEINGEQEPISDYSVFILPIEDDNEVALAQVELTATEIPTVTPSITPIFTPTVSSTPIIIPSQTQPPSATPQPTITATPTATSTPSVTPTPSSTPTPSATPTQSPTPTPKPPSGLSQTQLESAREYALALINQARVAAGLNAVALDDNVAAQSHADDMRENCTFSHWGTDGLTPYMRYTLAGGEQYSSENVSGIDFCPSDPNRYTAKPINAVLDEAMTGLMNSPGHRRNILNPHHRKVNIGISYRRPNVWLVQLFVGDYVEYESKPTIEDGLLTFSGTTKNGALVSGDALGVQIYYHQPPRHLSRGQLHHTYCYSSGLVVAGLRRPIGANQYYSSDSYALSGTKCGDPYDVDVNAPVATSYFDQKLRTTANFSTRVPWITATRWGNDNRAFDVSADIRDIVKLHGDGVYTTIIWGEIEGEQVPISQYSVFIPPIDDANEVVVAHVSPTPTQSRIELVIPTLAPAATNTPTATPAPATTPTPTSTNEIEVRQLEDLVHRLINDQRMIHGVDPIDHVEAIRLIAREHSEDMAARGYFSHESPEGFDPSDRAQQAGYSCRKDYGSYYTIGLAENIHQGWLFAGYRIVNGVTTPHNPLSPEQIAQQAVTGWMNSPGHRNNILDSSYDRAGLGVAIADDGKVFMTQNFC